MTTQVEAIFGVIFDLDGTLVSSELDFALIKAHCSVALTVYA